MCTRLPPEHPRAARHERPVVAADRAPPVDPCAGRCIASPRAGARSSHRRRKQIGSEQELIVGVDRPPVAGVRQERMAHDRHPGRAVGGVGPLAGTGRASCGGARSAATRGRTPAAVRTPGWRCRSASCASPPRPRRTRSTGEGARASGARRRRSSYRRPTSEPHRATPLMPIVSAWVTAELRPSKPQTVVGSPPHTIEAQRAVPVHPERWRRVTGRPSRPAIRWTVQW
jgi:hypothetical protein